MNNLNIIYGNGEDTKRKLDVLLEGAIKFYGSNYESLILDVVKNTGFYESDGKYNEKEVLEYLSGNNKTKISKFSSYNKIASFYLQKSVIEGKKSSIVATPIIKTDYDYHIFAHELFGHAICGKINPTIATKDELYKRNGISLTTRKKDYYDLLNEGFMEVIASSIVEQNKHNIKDISSINYLTARYCATKIFDTIGKEKMLKILVYYKYNIERIYNYDSKTNELKLLDKLLELELKTRDNPIINGFLNTRIEQNLNSFQKRKIRR